MLHRRDALLQVLGGESLPDRVLKDELKALIGKMKELCSNRNTVIHGTWGAKGAHISFEDSLDMEFGNKLPESIFADNPKNARKYSAEELRHLADELDTVRNDLWRFAREQWWRKWTDEIFLKYGFNALVGLRPT